MKETLITVPHPYNLGGVANYFNALRPHLSEYCEFAIIGRRGDTRGFFRNAWRVIKDYVNCWKSLGGKPLRVVHVNASFRSKSLIRDGVFCALVLVRRKILLVCFHGWDPLLARRLQWPARTWLRLTFFRAHRIFVLASDHEALLRDLGFEGPIAMTTTAVADNLFDIGQTRTEREPGESITFLFLGRLERSKGLYDAINAFRKFQAKNKNCELLIAGDGPEADNVRGLIEEEQLNRVRMLGYVRGAEKSRTLANSDVELFLSYEEEGMPVSLLEALAAGLGVIATPMGGIKDFFEDERMGFLVEPKNVAEISAAMQVAAKDDRRLNAMSRYNCRYARSRFSASEVAEKWRAEYASAIGGESL